MKNGGNLVEGEKERESQKYIHGARPSNEERQVKRRDSRSKSRGWEHDQRKERSNVRGGKSVGTNPELRQPSGSGWREEKVKRVDGDRMISLCALDSAIKGLKTGKAVDEWLKRSYLKELEGKRKGED